MPSTLNNVAGGFAVAALILLAGCGKPDVIAENELRSLVLDYHVHHDSFGGPPRNIDELERVHKSPDEYQLAAIKNVRDGEFVCYWDFDITEEAIGGSHARNDRTVLAHERDTSRERILVGYATGRVRWISREEFEVAPKAGD